jgi:hypothetical protein
MFASVAVPNMTALGTEKEDIYQSAARKKEPLYCVRIIKIVMFQRHFLPSILRPPASGDIVSI